MAHMSGIHARFQTCDLDRKRCSECGKDMDPFRNTDTRVLWKCFNCGKEINEEYRDAERVIYRNRKARDN